ncbi:acyl CoA binding protein-domain-containing protein [Mycotypha africana]|uniref:acyl CoA binding protein-domain-containing protein n=1 Tax=Mycotypha africana TaxID=64632 RepID=UPI002300F6E2|nr:acyl CoA binding protein-domain-containing protein [Mycotypha africana]KAI8967020.1 acyl CoA binding protein-domain-containing protein [Mycotypha africana]
MATIPPHYSDRFIVQRYNKALQFVQSLPASSNFQPTKNQKLELYALYKQVSEGNIKTQRPGLFDVVGRAKWYIVCRVITSSSNAVDAWKKLEGLSQIEARHLYVEALLRVAKEAYRKNMGREEAQQIIHTFAIMRFSDDETDDDLIETDTTSNLEDNEIDDTSIESENAEEEAYLRDVQNSNIQTDAKRETPFKSSSNDTAYNLVEQPPLNKQRQPALTRAQLQQHQIEQERLHQQQQQRQHQQNRPSSVASIQTMVTAPTTPRQLPVSSRSTSRLGQHASGLRVNNSRQGYPNHSSKDDLHVLPSNSKEANSTSYIETDFVDDSINPWQNLPSNPNINKQGQEVNSGASSDDNQDNIMNNRSRHLVQNKHTNSSVYKPQLRLTSPMSQYQQKQQLQHRIQQQRITSPSPPFVSTNKPTLLQQQLSGMAPLLHSSPVPGSSTSSSVTATPQNQLLQQHQSERPVEPYDPPAGGSRSSSRTHNSLLHIKDDPALHHFLHSQMNRPSSSVTTVALGPATKKALESLQNEVIALNDRINDLRRELVNRDEHRPKRKPSSGPNEECDPPDDIGDNWRWVIKAALKYAGVNIMTAFILFFILYKSDSPIAFAILRQAQKFWRSFKLRVLISNVVV